jgi:DNA adenine methylase
MSAASSPTITSVLPWAGCKRTPAVRKAIVAALGPHKSYFEPFSGGCSILFGKPPSPMEVINDLHGDAINVCRVVRNPEARARLIEMCEWTLCADDELAAAVP